MNERQCPHKLRARYHSGYTLIQCDICHSCDVEEINELLEKWRVMEEERGEIAAIRRHLEDMRAIVQKVVLNGPAH